MGALPRRCVVSDECYAALPWAEPYVSEGVPSLLNVDVCDGDASGLLVLYSLSKQSNLAGYRAALIYGDPALIAPIANARSTLPHGAAPLTCDGPRPD